MRLFLACLLPALCACRPLDRTLPLQLPPANSSLTLSLPSPFSELYLPSLRVDCAPLTLTVRLPAPPIHLSALDAATNATLADLGGGWYPGAVSWRPDSPYVWNGTEVVLLAVDAGGNEVRSKPVAVVFGKETSAGCSLSWYGQYDARAAWWLRFFALCGLAAVVGCCYASKRKADERALASAAPPPPPAGRITWFDPSPDLFRSWEQVECGAYSFILYMPSPPSHLYAVDAADNATVLSDLGGGWGTGNAGWKPDVEAEVVVRIKAVDAGNNEALSEKRKVVNGSGLDDNCR
ncbi:hypothetical protein JCM8097_001922 [Rhodosporidiobolus ruineniae]